MDRPLPRASPAPCKSAQSAHSTRQRCMVQTAESQHLACSVRGVKLCLEDAGVSNVQQLAAANNIPITAQPTATALKQLDPEALIGHINKLYFERHRILQLGCKADLTGEAGAAAAKTPQAQTGAAKLKQKV